MQTRLLDQVGDRESEAMQAVLDDLAGRALDVLQVDLVGVYLVGSFALGAGDLHADVDFLVVVENPLTADHQAGLRELHASMPDRPEHWARVLEGSYAALAQLQRSGTDPASTWLYVDNGQREMQWSTHDNTLITRWVLLHRAVTVAGVPACDLAVDAPAQALREEAVTLAVVRQRGIEEDPEYLANAWGQPHEVLTQCRMLYTASTATVAGKAASARWCLGAIPDHWHGLIHQAIADRPDPWERIHQQGDPCRAEQTREFVRYLYLVIEAAARGPVTR